MGLIFVCALENDKLPPSFSDFAVTFVKYVSNFVMPLGPPPSHEVICSSELLAVAIQAEPGSNTLPERGEGALW